MGGKRDYPLPTATEGGHGVVRLAADGGAFPLNETDAYNSSSCVHMISIIPIEFAKVIMQAMSQISEYFREA